MSKPDIYEQKRISMLAPKLRRKVFRNLLTHKRLKAGCTPADGKPFTAAPCAA